MHYAHLLNFSFKEGFSEYGTSFVASIQNISGSVRVRVAQVVTQVPSGVHSSSVKTTKYVISV